MKDVHLNLMCAVFFCVGACALVVTLNVMGCDSKPQSYIVREHESLLGGRIYTVKPR